MFSLCIPTMNRYDTFLYKYIPLYLQNPLIQEIIISDETGEDNFKINRDFPNNPKIILITNTIRLGPFKNKITACKSAKNDWIVLMDSDNFANEDYFRHALEYIELHHLQKTHNVILAPVHAKPNFNYTHLSGQCINSSNLKQILDTEKKTIEKFTSSKVLMNTGNYIIRKELITNLSFTQSDMELINNSSACDVILFNTLLFEKLDLNMHVVPNMTYEHVVHDGSVYIQTIANTKVCVDKVHARYNNLIN
jgi:glycosyltransferase involved in cell wall biosynthesis